MSGFLVGIADEYGTIWAGEPGASARVGDLIQRADEETFEVRLRRTRGRFCLLDRQRVTDLGPTTLSVMAREATEAQVLALIGILFAGRWQVKEAKERGFEAIQRLTLVATMMTEAAR